MLHPLLARRLLAGGAPLLVLLLTFHGPGVASVDEPLFHDCNGNGVEDAIDIALGTSSDVDFDGVPDECQFP